MTAPTLADHHRDAVHYPACNCGAVWRQRGNLTGHCTACHQTFQGIELFDRHQSTDVRRAHSMTTRPRLLDLFSCEGGAGMGYHQAGFDVVGVDIVNQRRYPFEFHQADALAYVAEHGHEYDAIHASPPCQAYSITKHAHTVEHPDLLAPTRAALQAVGKPYVIENVVGAPLIDPLLLCGTMFGLKAPDTDGTRLALQRHRLFESNIWLMGAGGCVHDGDQVAGAYGRRRPAPPQHAKHPPRRLHPAPHRPRRALGIDWMTLHGLSQAIPPAYTEFIGAQLLDALKEAA
jgi:DNA (cytosine-5)-methyltransferase 1